jgi:transcriptional antiterminator NusG
MVLEKKWYVVHTYTGHEDKVRQSILRAAKSRGLEDYFGSILVPKEEVTQKGRGRSTRPKKLSRNIFPGYIFIEMGVTDESWGLVRRTSGVTGFVGSATEPFPLSETEVAQIMGNYIEEDQPRQVVEVDLEEGDAVNITGGPFVGFTGTISEVYPDRGVVKVMVTIFGRATPMEVEIEHLEKF